MTDQDSHLCGVCGNCSRHCECDYFPEIGECPDCRLEEEGDEYGDDDEATDE